MIINVKTRVQGDEHNVFLEDFEGIVDGAGNPVTVPFTDNSPTERHHHIGLADIIAHAPIVATYEELPESGVVVLVRKDGAVGNLVTFSKMGDALLYEWMFDEPTQQDYEEVRLLHVGALALPSTEEVS